MKTTQATRWVALNRAPIGQITSPPNLLSVSRVLPVPFIYWCLKRSTPFFDHLTLVLLGFAMLTDALDGYLARRFRWQSELGLILDPLADKIFIGSLAIFLVLFREFPVWMAGLILGRDLAILGVSLFLFFRPYHIVVPASRAGKITTTVTSLALFLYVLDLQPYGLWCVWLAVVCIIVSVSHYGFHFLQFLRHSPSGRGAANGNTPEPARPAPVEVRE